ncbi:MAG TPA: hypothetical protein VG056_00455 [Pirellulales bacterium]|jgi:Sec-independent protein translocase protein TatA|nr:hypothetical protein [Pirellulales bacterium]
MKSNDRCRSGIRQSSGACGAIERLNSGEFSYGWRGTLRSASTSRRLIALLLVLFVPLVGGCSKPPQVPADAGHLIGSLRTAISAQKKDWLEANAKLVDEKHKQNKLTDEQYAEFESIIGLARDGNWSAAEKEVLRFAQAQQSGS